MRLLFFLTLSVCFGCALPPEDTTGQKFVNDTEFQTATLVKQGLGYAQAQRFVDADFAFSKALFIAPDAESVRFNLAVSRLLQERVDEALLELEDLYSRDRTNTLYRIWYARALINNHQYSAGLSVLVEGEEEALKKRAWSAASALAHVQAVILFDAGHEEEAICASARSAALVSDAEHVYQHVRLLLALGYPHAAKNYIDTFLLQSPSSVTKGIRYEQALVSYSTEWFDEALVAAKESFLLSPSDESIDQNAEALVLLSEKKLTSDLTFDSEDLKILSRLYESALYLPRKVLSDLRTFELERKHSKNTFRALYDDYLKAIRSFLR